MRRVIIFLVLSLSISTAVFAQAASDQPATREDVERYLTVMHSREMATKLIDSMAGPMHQMIHEQYAKNADKLPPDFEVRMNRMMDDMFKEMPWDQMIDAMIPSYQKHFTKGDLDALVAFYSTPTGQKILRELPAVTGEAMQAMIPMLQQQMTKMNDRMQREVAEMIKSAESPKPTATP